MAGESRSFHYCGLFSNIQEQLFVQLTDLITPKLVAVAKLKPGDLPVFSPWVLGSDW